MSQAQHDWVERVLGVRVGGAPPNGAARPLDGVRERLLEAGATLRSIGASETSQALARQFAGIQALYKAGDAAGAMAALDAFDGALAAAMPSARARDAAAVSQGAVARAKLRMDLQAAHADLAGALRGLATRILADPEVKADPRFGKAKALLDGLPALVPGLDDALVKALGSFDDAADAEARADASREAAALLARYRTMLDGEPVLQRMDAFAVAEFGGAPPVAQLRSAVAEIAASLAA